MFAVLHATAILIANLFKSRRRLEAENLWLRHQLKVALRRAPARLRLGGMDLCVPKTSSALIGGGNRLTLADHDRTGLLHLVGFDRPVQVEQPA